MTHQRKRATPSALTTIHTLDANDLRHVRGGEAVSNVLKTRHDTVKNTIGNIRLASRMWPSSHAA